MSRSASSSPAARRPRPASAIEAARKNPHPINWGEIEKPTFLGTRTFESYDLADLARHIDWTPFFSSWELAGRYPDILTDDVVGEAATDLFKDAQAMLKGIIDEKWFERTAWSASGRPTRRATTSSSGPTSERTTELARFHTLRQQMQKSAGKPNVALSDFVAPMGVAATISAPSRSPPATARSSVEAFKKAGDDYNAIMASALADRLAEAFAEALHYRVRVELWPYASTRRGRRRR
jgi:5-methyltetrahydrofolate--homocysteine methyltransferase